MSSHVSPAHTSHPQTEALEAALTNKNSVRCASTGNVDITSAPASIDGVALQVLDRILLKNQATASENGIRFFTAVGEPLLRTADADTSDAVLPGMEVIVAEGTTLHDTIWLLSTDAPIVLDTTPLTFTLQSSGGGGVAGDLQVRTVASADSLQDTDQVVLLDASAGPFTFTIPSPAARVGRPLTLARVNTGSNAPTVQPSAGTIDFAATWTPLLRGESIDLVADGATNWSAR